MEKFKLSKSLQRLMKKSNERFVNKLYFQPKEREELRESFIKSQKTFLEEFEKPLGPKPTIQMLSNRAWAEKFLDQMTSMIDLIDNVVPHNLEKWKLVNCYFELFIKPGCNYAAIKCNYEKGIPKKHYKTCLLIPFGFPRKGNRTRVQMIRGDYDLKGFELKDKGTFTQKIKSFQKVEQKFIGETGTIKFELTPRGNVDDNNWLRVVN